MLRKNENFIKSKEKNILNAEKIKKENKANNSFNKNILNPNRNKSKSKAKEKIRNYIFKTINILHNNKKLNKDKKELHLHKSNKNEKIKRLNLYYGLSNNIRNININNNNRYNNNLNNKIYTYNFLNNNSSSEDIKKERRKSFRGKYQHLTKKTKNKKNKNKNLSNINLTNLINNKYRINNSSLTKTKSTENINITKNIYNKSSDNETNFKNKFNKKMSLIENNLTLINNANINNKKVYNKNLQKKLVNKRIKTNYNNYKPNYTKSAKRRNRWTNSPGYGNIYKNSEKFMSAVKMKKICKTPLSHKRLLQNIYTNYRNNKQDNFNFCLFDKLCVKAKNVLEQYKLSMEILIKKKV